MSISESLRITVDSKGWDWHEKKERISLSMQIWCLSAWILLTFLWKCQEVLVDRKSKYTSRDFNTQNILSLSTLHPGKQTQLYSTGKLPPSLSCSYVNAHKNTLIFVTISCELNTDRKVTTECFSRRGEIEVTFQYKNVSLKNSKHSLIDKCTVLRPKVFLLKPVTEFL